MSSFGHGVVHAVDLVTKWERATRVAPLFILLT